MEKIKNISNKGNSELGITEKDLIRDILFVFQGIDGQYISFDESLKKFLVKENLEISQTSKNICNKIAELG